MLFMFGFWIHIKEERKSLSISRTPWWMWASERAFKTFIPSECAVDIEQKSPIRGFPISKRLFSNSLKWLPPRELFSSIEFEIEWESVCQLIVGKGLRPHMTFFFSKNEEKNQHGNSKFANPFSFCIDFPLISPFPTFIAAARRKLKSTNFNCKQTKFSLSLFSARNERSCSLEIEMCLCTQCTCC